MTLLDRFLVDPHMRNDARLAPLKATFDRSLHDPIDLVPTERHAARNAGYGHLEQQGDGQAFEALGELCAPCRPGNDHGLDAVLWAVNAWNQRVQVELIAAQIQIPPCSLSVIVQRAFSAALRTAPRAFPFESGVYSLALNIKARFHHPPGVFHAQELS
jgi:hypothetical protein